MQHPTFSATLAEQHREQLHHHADLARVARERSATRPARA